MSNFQKQQLADQLAKEYAVGQKAEQYARSRGLSDEDAKAYGTFYVSYHTSRLFGITNLMSHDSELMFPAFCDQLDLTALDRRTT